MIKIGILTFHRSTNNGALIQCFALCKQLQTDFPDCIIEVVDYEMPIVKRKIYPSNAAMYFEGTTVREKISKIKRFVKNHQMTLHCNLSPFLLVSSEYSTEYPV